MQFKGLAIALFVALGLAATPGQALADEELKIVGFGDSLMAGYELASGEGFPARLEAALRARGHEVSIADAGVSGDTTAGGLARLDWSITDGTDGVILELGANDMLRGLPPEKTRDNLEAMIKRLQERGIEVLLAGMLSSPNLGPVYESAFNSIYPDLADKYDLLLYPFFLDGVTGVAGMALSDGMHPNAKGINQMVEGFVPVAEEFIARLEAR